MATVLEERNATEPVDGTAPATTDRLAVIVPVYNEDRTVAELLRRLEAQPCVSQIIIVDDGSTDRTWEELEPWRAHATFTANTGEDTQSVIVLQHDKNRGKGRAIRTGLDHVTRSHVIIQDADLEYEPSDINKLWGVMKSGKADVVFGSRYLENSALQEGRWFMQSGVRFLNLLVRMLYGIKVTDEATCYKMFRTVSLRRMELRCQRFEFCPEVVAKIGRSKYRVVEVPIQYAARKQESGKKLSWRDGVIAVSTLVLLSRWFRLDLQSSTTRGVACVRMAVVLTLLFAAVSKLLVGSSNFQHAIAVTIELAIAVWLFSEKTAPRAFTAAAALFSVFLGHNIASVRLGDSTCSCLGVFAASPFSLLLLDAVLVGCLCWCLVAGFKLGSWFQILLPLLLLALCGVMFRVDAVL